MAQAGTVIETRLKQAGTPAESEAMAHATHTHRETSVWPLVIGLGILPPPLAAAGLDDQCGKHLQNIKAG